MTFSYDQFRSLPRPLIHLTIPLQKVRWYQLVPFLLVHPLLLDKALLDGHALLRIISAIP